MAIQSYKLLTNWDDPASTSQVLIEYVHQQVLWAHATCLHDVIIWSCLFFRSLCSKGCATRKTSWFSIPMWSPKKLYFSHAIKDLVWEYPIKFLESLYSSCSYLIDIETMTCRLIILSYHLQLWTNQSFALGQPSKDYHRFDAIWKTENLHIHRWRHRYSDDNSNLKEEKRPHTERKTQISCNFLVKIYWLQAWIATSLVKPHACPAMGEEWRSVGRAGVKTGSAKTEDWK